MDASPGKLPDLPVPNRPFRQQPAEFVRDQFDCDLRVSADGFMQMTNRKEHRKVKKNSRSPFRVRLGFGWVDPYMPWESVQGNGQGTDGGGSGDSGTPSGDSGGDVGGDGGAGL